MPISRWMEEVLDGAVHDLGDMATELDASRIPCCDKNMFQLWNNEEEARLHRRVIAMRKKATEMLTDVRRVLNEEGDYKHRLKEVATHSTD